jgi:hypothetical protein
VITLANKAILAKTSNGNAILGSRPLMNSQGTYQRHKMNINGNPERGLTILLPVNFATHGKLVTGIATSRKHHRNHTNFRW